MAQFPSLTKRRKHKFGHGLRQRYPEPSDYSLVSSDAQFVNEPPTPNPIKQAALLDRFLRFGTKYGEIDGRYGGRLRWRVAPCPVRYLPGPVDDVFCKLAEAYIRKTPSGYPIDWLHAGDVLYPKSTNPPQATVSTVIPDYTQDDMLTQLWGGEQSSFAWVADNNGGLRDTTFTSPDRVATLYTEKDGTYELRKPGQTIIMGSGAYDINGNGNLVRMAIELILWGHTRAPDGPGTAETSYWTQPPGFAAELWLRYVETFAGRILWQMAHTETCLMCSDLDNSDTGGRGGIVSHVSGTFKGTPAPATNPPLPPSTWQQVAPYVDKALTGLIETASAAIFTAL